MNVRTLIPQEPAPWSGTTPCRNCAARASGAPDPAENLGSPRAMHGAHPGCRFCAARAHCMWIQLWNAFRVQFFHQIRVQCCNGLAHTHFAPAAIRAIRARCALCNWCLPGGMWCIAMLAGAATLPCGTINRGCSHGVWGGILINFIHPLINQVRPFFCKSPTCSGDQPPTWTAHHGNQTCCVKHPTLCLAWRPRWLCNPTATPRSGCSSASVSRPQLTEASTCTALCGS